MTMSQRASKVNSCNRAKPTSKPGCPHSHCYVLPLSGKKEFQVVKQDVRRPRGWKAGQPVGVEQRMSRGGVGRGEGAEARADLEGCGDVGGLSILSPVPAAKQQRGKGGRVGGQSLGVWICRSGLQWEGTELPWKGQASQDPVIWGHSPALGACRTDFLSRLSAHQRAYPGPHRVLSPDTFSSFTASGSSSRKQGP